MVPLIPPELVDQIFEGLHTPTEERAEVWQGDPKGSLTACSLVCRSWNAISRPHLFRDVVYTYISEVRAGLEPWDDIPYAQADFGRWCKFPSKYHSIDPRVMEPSKTLSMLCDFLHDHPHCASCVRTLSLRGSPHVWTPALGDRRLGFAYDSDYFEDPEVFTMILAQLPRLSRLNLVDVFLSPPSTLFTPLRLPFASLRHVSMSYLTARRDQALELSKFIGGLCNVDELRVINAGFTDPILFPAQETIVPFTVGTVIMTHVFVLNGLVPQLFAFHPHTLVVDDPVYRDFADLSRCLCFEGSALRKLVVQVAAVDIPPFAYSEPPLDLSYCDNLETLSYTLEPYHYSRTGASASVRLLYSMLASLLVAGNKSLREVILRIRMDDGGVFPKDAGEAGATVQLDALLVDVATMNKGFRVRVKCEGDAKLTQGRRDAYLNRSFPRLVSSGCWAQVEDVDTWEKDPIHRPYLPFKL